MSFPPKILSWRGGDGRKKHGETRSNDSRAEADATFVRLAIGNTEKPDFAQASLLDLLSILLTKRIAGYAKAIILHEEGFDQSSIKTVSPRGFAPRDERFNVL
ncbi:hypothetical protein [Bradyrhizobium sp. 174]|uniref:hypothetical protein n=1 Tax=Bradyrhizobium sp. 174 TaxID=2782645 RepID=UPI001FF91134|nr:hypothetical protein [Bradyrhizobium sp. 174]MCK1574587.1 hypothetical protein [Bradyrhizobium sp. 174]